MKEGAPLLCGGTKAERSDKMLKWLWCRKKQDEDPARKVERLKEELQRKYDERERIRKAQSMLMENPSWLQLDEWIHRADLDSWLLRERVVYERRRLKKKMKLEFREWYWEQEKLRREYLEQEERRRLEYYRNIDLRVLLLGIEDSDRAERLLEWASRTAGAELPACDSSND